MSVPLKLHLRDLGKPMVEAWRREFASEPDIEISQGDIFSAREGVVRPGDPIDIRADAVVSPANSFGFMDGGIDAVYTFTLGTQVQEHLRAVLDAEYDGELPVGQAVIVPTERDEIPWCISAPTMRVPDNVANTVNAYLAFRAAILAVLRHNERGEQPIRTVLCPGLGTAVGGMPAARCARQMHAAWRRAIGREVFRPRSLREATADELELSR